MNDLDRRLVALDPAARAPYRHHDLEGLIARVTRQPARTRLGWRDFRLKVAGAVAASAAVTLGLIAAFEGAGPTLPVLALQGVASTPTPTFTSQIEAPAANATVTRFVAGPALVGATPHAATFELARPASFAKELTRVAIAFGVSRAHARHVGESWTTTSASGANVDVQSSAVPQWYYSSSSPAVAPATKSVLASDPVAPALLESTARRYLARLGAHYDLASPQIVATAVSTLVRGAPATVEEETLTATATLEGLATDQSVFFTVSRDDVVLDAGGPILNVAHTVRYPLRSPADGVAALNAADHAQAAASSVTLTAVSTTLASLRVAGGTIWLLPVYHYTAATRGRVTIRAVLALDPRYLRVATSAQGLSPGGVLTP